MCWMAAIPIAMQAGQMVMGNAQGNQATAATTDQSRRQAIQMVNTMNINNANANLKAQDTLDSASQDLSLKSMDKIQAMGTIRAAIGEGNLEGNSMNRVQRVTEGDYIRAANGVRDNYKRDYAAIFAGQLGEHMSTIGQIKSMQASEAKTKSGLEQLVDPLGLGINKLFKMTDIIGQKTWAGALKTQIDKSNNKANGT